MQWNDKCLSSWLIEVATLPLHWWIPVISCNTVWAQYTLYLYWCDLSHKGGKCGVSWIRPGGRRELSKNTSLRSPHPRRLHAPTTLKSATAFRQLAPFPPGLAPIPPHSLNERLNHSPPPAYRTTPLGPTIQRTLMDTPYIEMYTSSQVLFMSQLWLLVCDNLLMSSYMTPVY